MPRHRALAVRRRARGHPRETKTIALGYNTRAYKIATVVLAYGFGGLAGALYAAFAGFASPELFFWLTSGRVLIMVIVGGAGALIGPILGGVSFVFLEHQLSQVTDLWPLIFGAIFMAFVMFAPQGIWGILTLPFGAKPGGPDADGGKEARCRYLNASGCPPVRRRRRRRRPDGGAGEMRAVIGPNGAGKSTVFNLITSVLKPSARPGHLRRRGHHRTAGAPGGAEGHRPHLPALPSFPP